VPTYPVLMRALDRTSERQEIVTPLDSALWANRRLDSNGLPDAWGQLSWSRAGFASPISCEFRTPHGSLGTKRRPFGLRSGLAMWVTTPVLASRTPMAGSLGRSPDAGAG
jgi:hypothetical protein